MSKQWTTLCAVALALSGGAAGGQSLQAIDSPDGPMLINGVSKKYGNSITVSLIYPFSGAQGPFYFGATYLIHCSKGWISNSIASGATSNSATVEDALTELLPSLIDAGGSAQPASMLSMPDRTIRRAA